jgi:hypothetical protein
MMNTIPLSRPSVWPRVALGVTLAAVLAFAASAAFAGECPADKRVADGKGQPAGPTAPVGVDAVRASADLAQEPARIAGRPFRLRRLDILPGGVVPWHSHDNRPATIYRT